MNHLLLGNAVCLVGAVLMVAIGFIKRKKQILIVQSLQFAIMGAGNLILGGVTGGLSNFVGIARNVYCLRRPLGLWSGAAFLAVQAALTWAVNTNGLMGWLPMAATLVFTLSINTRDERLLKSAIIFGQLCWLAYDLWLRSYTSAVFDALTVLSNLWGIATLWRDKSGGEGKP